MRNSEEQNPEYWWREAHDVLIDALIGASAGQSRKTICNLLHASLERSLKALFVEKTGGKPPETHLLTELAETTGTFTSLSDEERRCLIKMSKMHSTASYPKGDEQSQIWYDDGMFKLLVATTKSIYDKLYGRSKQHAKAIEHAERRGH